MDPKRQGKTDLVVLFEIPGVIQDFVILPEEAANPQAIADAIRAKVKSREGNVGQVIAID